MNRDLMDEIEALRVVGFGPGTVRYVHLPIARYTLCGDSFMHWRCALKW